MKFFIGDLTEKRIGCNRHFKLVVILPLKPHMPADPMAVSKFPIFPKSGLKAGLMMDSPIIPDTGGKSPKPNDDIMSLCFTPSQALSTHRARGRAAI
jgi:hypothetical protein